MFIKDLVLEMGRVNVVVFNNFQQYYSYIMAVGFIGEGPRLNDNITAILCWSVLLVKDPG